MKISRNLPPNFESIKMALPNSDFETAKAIFCYGDTIYNPYGANITPDLEAHEMVHSKQQGFDPDEWWFKYLTNRKFRLEQEIEAYGYQYAFFCTLTGSSKLKEWFKEKCAEALSGDVYGNLISYGEAVSKIRNYAAKVEVLTEDKEVLLSKKKE